MHTKQCWHMLLPKAQGINGALRLLRPVKPINLENAAMLTENLQLPVYHSLGNYRCTLRLAL
ncbi:MAG: hypothetical protein DMG22_20260 [Acidobacteria bacterium]|nr:MAG: hypothetical protein DMG22_20260 [Acidobacteriota bacterium]